MRLRQVGRLAGLLVGVALSTVMAGSVVAQGEPATSQPAPEVPAFYTPPSPLPPGKPGELIRVEPMDAPAGFSAGRILYHSQTLDGSDIAVSGMVVVPDGAPPDGGFPLLTVAHATTGVARICAPSIAPSDKLNYYESFYSVIQSFLDAGFVVAATDYQGLGAPNPPAFLVGISEARNVLDAARAARKLPDLKLSDMTLIWGHSQGGQGAAFAGQIAADYAPDLAIGGVALAAPAAELTLMSQSIPAIKTPTVATAFFVLVAISWSQIYPGLEMSQILTPAGLATVPTLESVCGGATETPFQSEPPETFLIAAGATTPPWAPIIAQNVPGATRTPAPILVVQGLADTTIPPITTQLYVKAICGRGDTVQLDTYMGADHNGVLAASSADVVTWLNDRLAGKPGPSNCEPA